MSNKYYRFLQDPEASWKPYRDMPMYDDHPELGCYPSTMFLTSPQKGDYLIQTSNGELYADRPTDPEHFADVFFEAMPSLQGLLDKGIVVETPKHIMDIDYKLQQKMDKVDNEAAYMDDHLEVLEEAMQERRFGFPTKAARQAKEEFQKLEPQLFQMNKQFSELGAQLNEKVLAPLKQLQQRKKTVSLDETISGVAEEAQKSIGKGIAPGKETEHDQQFV